MKSLRVLIGVVAVLSLTACGATKMTKECIDLPTGTVHCNVYAGVRSEEGITRTDGYAFTPTPSGMQRAHVGTTTGENMTKSFVKSVVPTAIATAGAVVTGRWEANATKAYAKAVGNSSGGSGVVVLNAYESNTSVNTCSIGGGENPCK